MVEFHVMLGHPMPGNSQYREIHYSAQFVNDEGEPVELTRTTHIHAPFLEEHFTAAWLLSHIIQDFIAECKARSASVRPGVI
jgi:hypothetical protein